MPRRRKPAAQSLAGGPTLADLAKCKGSPGVRVGLASIQPERDPAPGQPEIRSVARQHDDAVMPVREQAPEDARGLIVAEMLGRLVEEDDGGRA